MNKSAALTTVFLVFATGAFAQTASISFANGGSTGVALVYNTDGTKLANANYVAQLFYSTDGTSFNAVGTQQPFFTVVQTSARAGQWKGGSFDFPVAVTSGSTVTLKVAVWDSKQFASWDAAANEIANPIADPSHLGIGGFPFFAGQSAAFSYKAPAAGDLNPDDFYPKNFPGLTLTRYDVIVPEPSVAALSVLGLGALLWPCRK